MTYIMLKKILHRYMSTPEVWEKLLPKLNHPYPLPQKRQMVNHIRGGGRSGFDTSVTVIHQQNGWREFITWLFSRLKVLISRLKIRG